LQEGAFLTDEKREIRLVETQFRYWDPMSLDVRGNVFVVRKCAGEGGTVRMGPRRITTRVERRMEGKVCGRL